MKRIWFCHCLNKRQLRESNSNKDNNHFHNAIRKYGEDSFEVTILDTITETTKEQLDRHLMVLEKTYIEHYDSFNLETAIVPIVTTVLRSRLMFIIPLSARESQPQMETGGLRQ